ncbi:unnamed protein product [Caenorhabditis sp. 36 PRJEB53466]|nr:unnamed protein product [Caenorhabditis sp. 36 PRJEB53466]
MGDKSMKTQAGVENDEKTMAVPASNANDLKGEEPKKEKEEPKRDSSKREDQAQNPKEPEKAPKKQKSGTKAEAQKKKRNKSKDKKEKATKKSNFLDRIVVVADNLLSKIPTKKDGDKGKEGKEGKKKDKAASGESQAVEKKEEVPLPKNVKDFIESVLDIEKQQTLNKYFLNTLIKIAPSATYTAFNANMSKNQSPDVFCNENNRVKINEKEPSKGDYIHANRITFEGLKRTYIATQHPLKGTVDDFFTMVFTEEIETIVSLSATSNTFPTFYPTEKDTHVDLPTYCVSCKFVKLETKYSAIEYTLEVLPHGCSQGLLVRLLKYSRWGKYQVPGSPKVITSLVKSIKKSRGPLVVQCETGVNQSAALIYIDAILGLLEAGQTPSLETVFRELKSQRHSALSQRLHFSYAVFAILVILRVRAKQANQIGDCLKEVEEFEKEEAVEFVKSAASEPSDPKISSPTLDQTIG